MGSHGGIAPRYFLVLNWGLLNWHSEGWKPHGEQGRPCCLVKPDLSPRPAGLASASGAGMRAWEVPWIGLWPYPVLRKLLNLIHSPVSCAWAEPGHPCLPSYSRLYAVPGQSLGTLAYPHTLACTLCLGRAWAPLPTLIHSPVRCAWAHPWLCWGRAMQRPVLPTERGRGCPG